MKSGIFVTTLAGALVLALAGVSSAQAGTCEQACTTKHTTCTRNGGEYGACMSAWHQCKTSCKTPARMSSPPAPKAPASTIARR